MGTPNSERAWPQIFLESFFKVDLGKLLKPDFRTLKIKGCLKIKGLALKMGSLFDIKFVDMSLARSLCGSYNSDALLVLHPVAEDAIERGVEGVVLAYVERKLPRNV